MLQKYIDYQRFGTIEKNDNQEWLSSGSINKAFKMNALQKLLILFLGLFILTPQAFGQYWGSRRTQQYGIWDQWYLNVNAGQTSFFGDISLFDDDIPEKLSKESDWGFGIVVGKGLNPYLYAGIQILSGRLKGQSPISRFEANILEYTLVGNIDFVNLLLPNNNSRLKFIGIVGVGQFMFNSRRELLDKSLIEEEDTGIPEFVYMFGLGGFITINERLKFTTEIALRQAQNDKLDIAIKNKDMDYYTYFCAGLTYTFKGPSRSSRGHKNLKGRYPMRRRKW